MKYLKYGFVVFLIYLHVFAFSKETENTENKFWTGINIRFGWGNIFDFELKKAKGDDLPTEALFMYGLEYGYQFQNNLFLGAGLDWTIVYPRNFKKFTGFFEPPASLWYIPITNVEIGYGFHPDWLVTLGLVYYWGMSYSLRYRVKEALYIETRGIVWMDRVFNKGGFYGGGFDNLDITVGLGYYFH